MKWEVDSIGGDDTILSVIDPDKPPMGGIYAIHTQAMKAMRQMHKGFRRKKKLIKRLRAEIERMKDK